MTDCDEPHEYERPSLFLLEKVSGPGRWRELRERIEEGIQGHEEWRPVISAWLDEASSEGAPGRIRFAFRDSGDFLLALVLGGPKGVFRFLPCFRVELEFEGYFRRLRGRVEKGEGGLGLARAVRSVYSGPAAWEKAREEGDIARTDRRLRSGLGIVHAVDEEEPDGEKRLIFLDENGGVRRQDPLFVSLNGEVLRPDSRHPRRFFREYRDELKEVAEEFRSAAPSPPVWEK